ncbi:MAG: YkgJ family cysteine cluster protein, partial [Thermofilaceae archaeon]
MNQIESIWKSRSYCLSCSLCCKNTEMVLTPSDIERIGEHGFKKEDFIEIVDGFFKLKNVEGHCVFLREGRC